MDLNDRENIFPYIRSTRDDVDPPNIVHLLNNRQLGLKRKSVTQLQQFAEYKSSVSEMKETHCELPASARSTFLMSFSHDCTKVASTHGDHNIYVSDVITGKPIRTLEGHPRTPWCIAFHPTSNEILASGCLAGEVRVWDLHGGSERWRAEHDQVIASLAFHPTTQLLVIATGNSLHFWNWSNPKPDGCCSTNSELERVRYVKFDLLGHRLITGISNLSSSGSGLQNNAFGDFWHAGYRSPHSPHPRQNHRDLDDHRTSRRSIMERLRILPEQHETSFRRQHPRRTVSNRTDRNAAASSYTRAVVTRQGRRGTPSASNTPERSGATNRSRSSGVDNQPRPNRNNRATASSESDRSSATVRGNRPHSTGQMTSVGTPRMFTETFTEEVRRLFQGWLAEEFGPFASRLSESSSSDSPQTVRTPPEDDSNTVTILSATSGENNQTLSPPLLQTFSLPSMNSVGTSTDHLNSSLSDHDYFSESDTPQSRANNNENLNNSSEPSSSVRNREDDSQFFTSGEFWHTFNRLRGICTDLERRLSRHVYLQRNYASEVRAGPSVNDGGSGVGHSTEMTVVPRSDNGEVDPVDPYSPIINMLSRIRVALRFSTLSLTAVRDRIEQIRHKIREIITRIRYWTGGRHVGRMHHDIFEEMTVQLTEQMDRLLQADMRLANTMTLSEESTSVQGSNRSSVTSQNVLLQSSSAPEEMSVDSYQNNEQSSEMRNAFRNPALSSSRDTYERPTVNENRAYETSGSSPSRVRLGRLYYNPLNYVRRSRIAHLHNYEELVRYQQERLQLLEDLELRAINGMHSASGLLEVEEGPSTPHSASPVNNSSPVTHPSSSSVQLTVDVPSSPLTIDISSPASMDISSPSVTAEASSIPVNTENSTTFTRNYPPQPRTLDLSDADLIVVSRIETDNHRTDRLRAEDIVPSAEASTQASSASSSRDYSQIRIIDLLEDISDTDDDIFTGVRSHNHHSHEHNSNGQGEFRTTAERISAITAREIFERLQLNIEDMSDTEMEDFHHIRHSTRRSSTGVASSPSPAPDLDLLNASGSRASRSRLSSYFDPIIEPISDASSDDSDRPITPPLLMYSPTYNSLLFNGNSRIALNDPLTQNHRIQVWDFSSGGFPPIYDANANVVVRRCMIHNDASVDISQDGEKLVALIPPEDRDPINNLMFGVFSLRPGHLGRTLCIWGYISNAISVSFSPLAQYVVVGSAYSRPIYSNPEKAAVAQIIKINKSKDSYDASYIRSFTQVINNENRFQQVSLNCVRWLPMSGLGIAYATNRGCLCICKPIAGEMFENVPNAAAPVLERTDRGIPFHRFRAFMRP